MAPSSNRKPTTPQEALLIVGRDLLAVWCEKNPVIAAPEIIVSSEPAAYNRGAVYNPQGNYIAIAPNLCRRIGYTVPFDDYPGWAIDRTPVGMLADAMGYAVWPLVPRIRLRADEPETFQAPYRADDREWFADLFRLYITNPDLLRRLRPRVFAHFFRALPGCAETRGWEEVLKDSPAHLQLGRQAIALRRMAR